MDDVSYLEVFIICFIIDSGSQLRHRIDANDPFEGEIGLKLQWSSKIVGGH